MIQVSRGALATLLTLVGFAVALLGCSSSRQAVVETQNMVDLPPEWSYRLDEASALQLAAHHLSKPDTNVVFPLQVRWEKRFVVLDLGMISERSMAKSQLTGLATDILIHRRVVSLKSLHDESLYEMQDQSPKSYTDKNGGYVHVTPFLPKASGCPLDSGLHYAWVSLPMTRQDRKHVELISVATIDPKLHDWDTIALSVRPDKDMGSWNPPALVSEAIPVEALKLKLTP